MRVTLDNFKRDELSCRCCGEMETHDHALLRLQAFRYYCNAATGIDIPLNVNSAYRCHKHNFAVGGRENSRHLFDAFDLWSTAVGQDILYNLAVRSKLFTTVIEYQKSRFVHVDCRPRAPKEIKHWGWDK